MIIKHFNIFLTITSVLLFTLITNAKSTSKSTDQKSATEDDGSDNLINLNGAGSDNRNPKKPVNKLCLEFDKQFNAYYAQLQDLPQEMTVEMQKLKDSSEQDDFERKYQKKVKDIQLKMAQLQMNPKYKKCNGSLSVYGNPIGN